MNVERILRRLTVAARNDRPPVIDVSNRVIESINRLSVPTSPPDCVVLRRSRGSGNGDCCSGDTSSLDSS